MTLTFFLPGRWPSLNDLKDATYWNKGGRKKVDGWAILKAAWGVPAGIIIRSAIRRDKQRPVFSMPVHIKFYHQRPDRRGDPDNFAAAAAKVIIDAMVKEKVIGNDGFNYISGIEHVFTFKTGKDGILVVVSS